MQSRHNLRSRRRRLLWNNDGDDLLTTAVYDSPGNEFAGNAQLARYYAQFPRRFATPDELLRIRMKGKVDGTQVDTVCYQGYTVAPNWEFPTQNTAALGADPLIHVVDYCHAHGMEFFYSMRMNDIHRAVHQGEFYWSRFAVEHPELLQSELEKAWFDAHVLPWARGETDVHPLAEAFESGRRFFFRYPNPRPTDERTWAAYDWGKREVRDYFHGLIQEACRRYDLEGIELDYSRTPPFFKCQHHAHAPVMTDFIRRVRQWLDRRGKERGRPVLLAVKVNETPADALHFGLDVQAWLDEDLIDIIIGGFGARPFTCEIGAWVAMGHAWGVPVYGCIENGLPGQAKTEIIRASARRYLEAGADGCAVYDHFFDTEAETNLPANWPHVSTPGFLREIGELGTLCGLDATYLIDMYGDGVPLPLYLSTESGPCTVAIPFEIAEDPAGAEVTLQAQWAPEVDIVRTALRLNGVPVPPGEPFIMPLENDNQGWYAHPVTSLRAGENCLEVTAQPAAGSADILLFKQVRMALARV